MLTLFRTNQQFANILLLLYLGIVRFSTFINHPPTPTPAPQGILTEWMYSDLPPNSLAGYIAAYILVFIQAVFINLMMSRYRVMSEASLFPGLFYCLLTSFLPEFLPLSSILLANTFIILAIFFLFDVYKNTRVAARIFDVGFWIGMAALFHFSYTLFFFWGFVGLGILRGLRFNELMMFLIGVFVPFFLFGTYLFWIDKFPLLFSAFGNNFSFFNFIPNNSPTTYIKLALITLLIIVTIFSNGQTNSRRNINTQKFVTNIYWLLLLAGITVIFQSKTTLNHALILAVPLSMLLSIAFQRIGIATAEVLHMLLLVIAMILQFEYLLV
jgi:hypothetical protein